VNAASGRTTVLQRYGWEASVVGVIGVVIATLGLVTHLTPPRVPSNTDLKRIPKLALPQSPLGRVSGTSTWPSREGASGDRHHGSLPARRSSPPSDPHEVVIGPNSISGRFILMGVVRKQESSASDELVLRLRVVSLAVADLVTPFQSEMLDVRMEGQEPVQPQHAFSHPVPAGNQWDQDVVFSIPSGPSLAHATLRIHYYPEVKEIPLDLPPRIDTRQH
jgi:hypothetical protein